MPDLPKFNYKEMREKFYKPPSALKSPGSYAMGRGGQVDYYYIACKQDGHMVLLGAYESEAEAYEVAMKKLKNTPYEVVALKTKDRRKATSIMRHRILNSSSDLGLSLRRMKHRV